MKSRYAKLCTDYVPSYLAIDYGHAPNRWEGQSDCSLNLSTSQALCIWLQVLLCFCRAHLCRYLDVSTPLNVTGVTSADISWPANFTGF